jgi:DNA polymerase-3 subunit epsilon
MNFKNDLLLVDLEMTGTDPNKHEIIQLSAILLDKKTLEEKAFFNSYIKPKNWRVRNPQAMEVNRISYNSLKNSKTLEDVLKSFDRKFKPSQVILSFYGGLMDMDFLRAAYRQTRIPWRFDYHYFNLWALCFSYLGLKGRLKNSKKFTGFELEDLMKTFKIKSQNRHDGLEDCRVEAEVFRKIMIELK